MKNYEYLNEEAYDTLSKDSLKLDIQQYSYNDGLAPYFREHVRLYLKEWLKQYNEKKDTSINFYTDGLKIHTTINYEMQKLAEESVQEHLSKLQQQFEEITETVRSPSSSWLTDY